MTTATVTAASLVQERRVVTEIPGPRSRAIAARRAESVSAGVGSGLPVYAEAAGGGIVRDVDGNQFVDLGSGIAVTGVGSANPAVVAAVQSAVERMTHTCFMVTPTESYIEVAEELARVTPGDHAKRSVLVNSGSEAVENVVKIARNYTGRPAVVVFDGSYHGRTNLTLALTAKNDPYKQGFGPFAPEVYRAPGSFPFHDGLTGEQAAARTVDYIEKYVGAKNVAAVLIEPVQGEGGFVEPAPGFLQALVDWCHANGALFAADEVQAGFCRTGDWFACDHEGIVPDLISTAKGIGGGLPIAAVTGRAEIMDAVQPGGLGGTYGGNPVACAAAVATIRTMRDEDLPARARRIETRIRAKLATVDYPGLADVRGRGAMIGLEFVKPGTETTTKEPDPAFVKAVIAECLAQGVILLDCGLDHQVIRLLPPFVIDLALLDDALDVLVSAVEKVAAGTAR